MSAESLRQVPRRVVGAKQTLKKIARGAVSEVYVAKDADPGVVSDVIREAEARTLPLYYVPTMEELGRQCGIQVGAACAAVLEH